MTQEGAFHAQAGQRTRCVEGPAARSCTLGAIRVSDDVDKGLTTDEDQGNFTVESRLSPE